MPLGFVLHPTYFIERGRPVIHLFGRLETGETFVAREDRPRPHFYVRTRDLPAARRIATFPSQDSDWTTPAAEPVSRVFAAVPGDVPGLREAIRSVGIPTFEADIPFVTHFLLSSSIRGALRLEGESRAGRRVGRIFHNPRCEPAVWIPRLRVLSLDIETDPEARQILSIALWGDAVREVLVAAPAGGGPEPSMTDAAVRSYPGEEDLLKGFLQRLSEIDPDVLTGWNLIDFDLRVCQERFAAHHIPFHLGRADLPCHLLLDRSTWGTSRAVVPGRAVLDGLSLLRGAFQRLEDYRLETAAREILGEGKTVSAEDRGAEILRLYQEDLPAFLKYNLTDARLVWEILEKKKLVELSVRRSLLTGMPLDRVGASIASFDFLYLSELHERGIVAPTVESDRPAAPTRGGFVLDSRPGIYEQVCVLDYRSLYPSLIRTFRLDPLSLMTDGDTASAPPVVGPNGARFRREGGILPEILDRLFPLREQAIAEGDFLTATALKILMNSFYGVLATTRCRFYSPETANAITGFGQETLLWTCEVLEKKGYRVLYGDTDSIFVEVGASTENEGRETGRALAAEITDALARRLRERHGVESRLELRFDRLFRRLLLPSLRHSREGSKKRYVGLLQDGPQEELVFVGLESVRRDWTDLSKLFQREMVRRAFRDEPLGAFVRDFLQRLRRGEMDSLLIYRKALRKPAKEYTHYAPPHVQAARQMVGPPGRIIRYVITTAGPEPEEDRLHPLDYDHYEEKQLRPVAESILSLLGLTWDGVTGRQGNLGL